MNPVDFEGELDRLYRLPLKEFTAARDELAKRLRAEGEPERAAEVKQLRKPTAAVWLVNQLAKERELDLQRLLKAGESLTTSQAKAAAGASSETFAEARRDEQHAVAQLAKAAREIARRAAIGAPAVEKATETLRAASLTSEGRELLRRGRLTEELEPPGFEVLTGMPSAPAKPKRKPARDQGAEKRQALRRARERVGQLRAEERELLKAAQAAAREAERAKAEADAADQKAREISEQREAAEAEVKRLG
jgi:hypothetical protein